jgi:hypothetical protein
MLINVRKSNWLYIDSKKKLTITSYFLLVLGKKLQLSAQQYNN